METTLSPSASLIPLTPVEARDWKTRTSVVGKRIALPVAVTSITSSDSEQMRALTSVASSSSPSNFIAILPLRMTLVKSDSAFRRTPPLDVANMICNSPHSSSGRSTGIIAAMETPGCTGSTLTMGRPRVVRDPSGNCHVFSL